MPGARGASLASLGAVTLGDAVRFSERAGVVLFLLLFSQALLGPLLADPREPESAAILRVMWLPVYAITLVMAFARPRAFGQLAWASALVLIPVAIAALSPLWALDPGLAGRRVIALVMTTAFGLVLAMRYDWRALLQVLAVTMAILVVGSYLAALLAPGFGVHQSVHPGAWKGLWWEKNTLGAVMARAFLIFVCAAILRPDRARLWGVFAALAVGLVFLSTSKTALLALLCAAACLVGIRILRQGPVWAVLFGATCLAFGGGLALMLVVAPVQVLEAMGRDATLTGRTDIWAALTPLVQDRLWLGYGYDVFWSDPRGPSYWVARATEWEVPTAHNGWFELMLAIGAVGTLAFLISFIAVFTAALSRLGRGPEAYFAIGWLALFLLFSISESAFLQRNSWEWVVFVAVAAKLLAGERVEDPRAHAA